MWKQGSCIIFLPVVLFRLNHSGKLQHTIWAPQPGCIAIGLAGHHVGDSENDGMSNFFTFSASKH